MTDVLTAEQRSLCMSRIRGAHTRPEMIVRSLAHRMGFRYRLHCSDLPGKPDLVFPRLSKIIFVHGCFWHMHHCRYGKVKPATNTEFWQAKRTSNVVRDRRNLAALRRQGWHVRVIWECWTRNPERVEQCVREFLER